MPDATFLDAQLTYESLGSLDLDSAIAKLDTALSTYSTPSWQVIGLEGQSVTVAANTNLRYGANNNWVYKNASGSFTVNNGFFGSDPAPGIGKSCQQSSGGSEAVVETAFAPIAEYYTKLVSINTALRKFINKSAKNIADSDPRLINEERYSNRVHPEEAVMAREATRNFFPELRTRSVPYLIAASVFMATLSIFLILQMNGFGGQIIVPPGIKYFINLSATPADISSPTSPFVFRSIVLLVLFSIVIFGVMYYIAKNTNRSRQ